MGERRFPSQKEAQAWLEEELVAEAIEPVLAFVHPKAVPELRAYLDDLLRTHLVVGALFRKAAKELVLVSEQPLRQAARLAGEDEEEDDDDPSIPKTPKAAHKLDPLLVGLPDLANPKYREVAGNVVKALAKHVSKKWRGKYDKEHVKELVGVGWVVAVEVSPDWNPAKALYSTYLWHFVRCRLINHEKKHSHRFETPMSGISMADVSKKEGDPENPSAELRRLLAEGTTSWMLGSLQRIPETPEEKVLRVVQREEIVKLIRTLDEDEQKIIALVYTEDMSCREASKHLDVSESTAVRWHRAALQKLRAGLEKSSNVRTLRRKN